jgi:uncharacterized protein YgiM (DUF1202 family)
MFARSLAIRSFALGLSAAVFVAVFPANSYADDPAPQVDNSKVSFSGVVNSNAVYVRSGPGENYYATLKLDKGAQITVVGLKFDWLKVIPPEGSFSYVAKAYVEKRGDGSVGRVTKPDLNVRAGSDLNALKTTVQTKLDENEDVAILGEQDEYFKIKPPQGAYLYINKQFVDPVKALPAVAAAAPATDATDPKNSEPIASAPMVTTTPDAAAKGAAAGAALAASTTQPSNAVAAAPTTQSSEQAAAPSTQPATPTAETQFDAVESEFLDATNKPLQDQPIEELQTKYTELSTNADLPASMRRIVEMRQATLKLRANVRQQYVEAQKMQDLANSKQTALKAEQAELTQRVKDQQVTTYTAIGTLRTSSLQIAGTSLYRLTDPNTGRTLVYIKSSDAKYAELLNQFIGVRGDIVEDAVVNLKTITPTGAEAVDQSKVNSTITAEVLPPSLLPKTPTASINSN